MLARARQLGADGELGVENPEPLDGLSAGHRLLEPRWPVRVLAELAWRGHRRLAVPLLPACEGRRVQGDQGGDVGTAVGDARGRWSLAPLRTGRRGPDDVPRAGRSSSGR